MKGVDVCPQPRAADVGAAILAKGGNAFDAAVATAFSQMVNDPFMCGIGGMGTLHYYRADTNASGMVDYYNRAGSKVEPGMWEKDCKGRTEISGYSLFDDYRSEIGYTSIMTPGTPAMRLATIGRPAPIASINVFGSPSTLPELSRTEGSTKISAAFRPALTASRSRAPGKSTA